MQGQRFEVLDEGYVHHYRELGRLKQFSGGYEADCVKKSSNSAVARSQTPLTRKAAGW